MEGLYTGKGHGQIVPRSLLSSFPVGNHTKINTNKQNLQKELEQDFWCFIYELSIGQMKKKNLNKIKNLCTKNHLVAYNNP